MSYANVLHIN